MNQNELDIKYIQSAYTPYRKEAFYCLIIDIVVAISIVLLLLLARAGWFILPILPLFALCTFCVNYLTILRIHREAGRGLFETATLEILSVKEIPSAAGYFGTILREIHPKAMKVGRCKLHCRDEGGNKLTLQCIMSEPRVQALREGIDGGQLTRCHITYGRKSRILCTCAERGRWADALNQKI